MGNSRYDKGLQRCFISIGLAVGSEVRMRVILSSIICWGFSAILMAADPPAVETQPAATTAPAAATAPAEAVPAPAPAVALPPVSYHKQIWPVVQRQCQGCHQPAKQGGKLVMVSYDEFK